MRQLRICLRRRRSICVSETLRKPRLRLSLAGFPRKPRVDLAGVHFMHCMRFSECNHRLPPSSSISKALAL
eukprot:3540321-Pyramimonas_sp.AAC.1